jgi:hypothetical protein
MDSEELAVLIAEQERDMRLGHRVYSLSITEFVDNVVDGNGVLGAFLQAPRPLALGLDEPTALGGLVLLAPTGPDHDRGRLC